MIWWRETNIFTNKVLTGQYLVISTISYKWSKNYSFWRNISSELQWKKDYMNSRWWCHFWRWLLFIMQKLFWKKHSYVTYNLIYFIFTADICDRTASWCEYSSGWWDGFRTLHVVWGANQFAKSMVALNSKFLKLNPLTNHLVTLFHFTYNLCFVSVVANHCRIILKTNGFWCSASLLE